MILSSFKYRGAVSLLLFLTINTSVFACDGQELKKSLNIIHEALFIGYQAGLTGNFQGLFSKTEQLGREIEKLSPSCQALAQQISDSLRPRYDPTTTSCSGSVCCDGSGCYSN